MPKAKEGSVSLAWKSSLKGDAPEVYTFNITGGGFVIVSGDEGTQQEVLGWSDTGAYDDNVMPDGLRWLVGEYARMIAAYRDSEEYGKNMSRVSRKAPVSGYGKVEPLLRTTWGQDIDLYGYQYAGCVATAVAAILNYHRWPKTGYGSHTNIWEGNQSVDFTQSTYAWGNMEADDYNTRNTARQKLLYDVGCAVNTHYDQTNGSEAYTDNAYKALVTNFGYDEGRVKHGGGCRISHYAKSCALVARFIMQATTRYIPIYGRTTTTYVFRNRQLVMLWSSTATMTKVSSTSISVGTAYATDIFLRE
jgi:hypothetical protein